MDLPTADHELSDAEILERFGAVLDEADRAFRADPGYVVGLAEQAAKLRSRRAVRLANPEPERPRKATKPEPEPSQPGPSQVWTRWITPIRPEPPAVTAKPESDSKSSLNIPVEVAEAVVARRKEGASYADLTAEFRASNSTIVEVLKRAGLAKSRPRPAKADTST